MLDILIVGAGPAGAIAGVVAARAGARVRLIDRARFPRDKLCGDTINPGTLARLRHLGLHEEIDRRGLRVDGMILTGERAVGVVGRYPEGVCGRAIVRRELDWLLLQQALAAGCQFDDGIAVQRIVVRENGASRSVTGAAVGANGANGATRTIAAPVIIAADGRRSTIAFGLGLARHPARPRRWAIGGYFDNFMPTQPNRNQVAIRLQTDPDVAATASPRGSFGEMHVRRNCYIGVAPLPGGLTNVCLVKPSGPGDADLRDPTALLTRALARDPLLRDRAADARLATQPVVLGPLAVDVDPPTCDGLILAGDAAGFIDPMTGDGLRFAVRGGELAAAAALDALEHGWSGVRERLAAERRREFAAKWRFNRLTRALVGSRRAVDAATIGGQLVPRVFETLIAHAGDCYC